MTIKDDSKGSTTHVEVLGADFTAPSDEKDGAWVLDRDGAIKSEEQELKMSLLEGLRAYPNATWWSFCISLCIIMEGGCLAGCRSSHFLQDTTMPRSATSSQCRSIASALATMSVLQATQRTTISSLRPGNPLLDRPPILAVFCKFTGL